MNPSIDEAGLRGLLDQQGQFNTEALNQFLMTKIGLDADSARSVIRDMHRITRSALNQETDHGG